MIGKLRDTARNLWDAVQVGLAVVKLFLPAERPKQPPLPDAHRPPPLYDREHRKEN